MIKFWDNVFVSFLNYLFFVECLYIREEVHILIQVNNNDE